MAYTLKFKMVEVYKIMAQGFTKPPPRRMERIIGCYDSPYGFGLDLSSAVIRQGSFIEKMVSLGWTGIPVSVSTPPSLSSTSNLASSHPPPGIPTRSISEDSSYADSYTPQEMNIILVRCIARYHAFLDLMSASGKFYVPTLDIDLAWHTHQLKCEAYR